MKNNKKRIAQSFQRWLIILVSIAFLATTVFLWLIQSRLSENNAVRLLQLNLADVRQDIVDASDEHMISLARSIAEDLNVMDSIVSSHLTQLLNKYDVTEINVINQEGFIFATTHPDFMDYDMRSGKQSLEFMVLLEGQESHVQKFQPVSYDASISRKYGGVVLENGGFVQVGYDGEHLWRDVSEIVVGVTRNRHIGEGGCMIIADGAWNIISDRYGNEGQNLMESGIWPDAANAPQDEVFITEVHGMPSYCLYRIVEGYHALAVIPTQEAAVSRNVSVGVTTVMQVLVFAALFVMIYVLVNKLVVQNIYQINESLSAITEGRLDTVVDVRSHAEFDALSNDINSTVDTLKRYIADAEARIDAELAFAKAIQHSAMPSVFPPYPGRREFDIHAAMYTAKEVGGDFYDFYFIDEDTLVFLVADVSGKGIPAAMFMMRSKTLIKSCAESGMSVEEVFTMANEKLCEGNEAGMFVTAWMGVLNVKTGCLFFANAGHNPPLLRHADGSFEYLKTRAGFVLGGMEGIRYRKNELQLQSGDVIYLYTDGVTEATDVENQLYGEERLRTLMNERQESGAQAICEAVKADMDAFVGEAEQFDDITMLCLNYNGGAGTDAEERV